MWCDLRDSPGVIREMRPASDPLEDNDFVPYPGLIGMDPGFSYANHGKWVKDKRTGEEGKICYADLENNQIMVYWGLRKKKAAAGWSEPEDLTLLRRKPEPWYDFTAINRRLAHNESIGLE